MINQPRPSIPCPDGIPGCLVMHCATDIPVDNGPESQSGATKDKDVDINSDISGDTITPDPLTIPHEYFNRHGERNYCTRVGDADVCRLPYDAPIHSKRTATEIGIHKFQDPLTARLEVKQGNDGMWVVRTTGEDWHHVATFPWDENGKADADRFVAADAVIAAAAGEADFEALAIEATHRADQLEAALKRFGRHDRLCEKLIVKRGNCTCGYDDALAAPVTS